MKRRQPVRLHLPAVIKSNGHSLQKQASHWADHLLPASIGKNATVDSSINRTPLRVIAGAGIVLFAILFLQLFQLQVVEGERMRGIAEGNRVREQVDFAPRGRILDRNGVVLADNTASFQLSVTPYLLPELESERLQIYDRIATLTAVDNATIKAAAEGQGLEHPQPVLVVEQIGRETALQLEYTLPQLTGFSLDTVPIRKYKSEAALAHILGYVGRVSENDIEARPDLHPLDFSGKLGIEAAYDEQLRGVNGVVETEVDSLGRPLRTLRQLPTEPGEDIYLSLDFELQQRLRDSIKERAQAAGVERGSGVIMHARTGEVLASVSLPDYDNNLFSAGITPERYSGLLDDLERPMLNRAMNEGFPTGSVIKPVTLAGALDTGTVDANTTIVDRGSLTLRSPYDPSATFTFHGYNRNGLGPVTAVSALARSSNIYFFTVAGGYEDFRGMGIDNLVKYYRMFGLGSPTGVDIPGETAGLVPSPAWKQQMAGEEWYIGDTYNLAIGQGDLLASPLQMARAYAAIVNGGNLLQPQLKRELEPRVMGRADISAKHYDIIERGMQEVISSNGTTSPATFAQVGVPVGGKSGTAETDPGKREAHAWFAAYAPRDDPELVAVVLIEEGFAGSTYAAPPIADAFELYFKRD